MWRKNQETPTPAVVPTKPETNKTEAAKPVAKAEESPVTAAAASSAVEASGPAVAVAPAEPVPAPQAAVKPALAAPQRASKPAPRPLPANVDSCIGSGLKIRGEITGSADMYIDGNIEGKIRIGSGVLTIGSEGRVQADVEAREILVNGTVLGNLKATDRVQLGATGSVQGGIVTPRIGIEDGARLRGSVETARTGESRTAPEANKAEVRVLAAAQSNSE